MTYTRVVRCDKVDDRVTTQRLLPPSGALRRRQHVIGIHLWGPFMCMRSQCYFVGCGRIAMVLVAVHTASSMLLHSNTVLDSECGVSQQYRVNGVWLAIKKASV
jgi:hypothetical protein